MPRLDLDQEVVAPPGLPIVVRADFRSGCTASVVPVGPEHCTPTVQLRDHRLVWQDHAPVLLRTGGHHKDSCPDLIQKLGSGRCHAPVVAHDQDVRLQLGGAAIDEIPLDRPSGKADYHPEAVLGVRLGRGIFNRWVRPQFASSSNAAGSGSYRPTSASCTVADSIKSEWRKTARSGPRECPVSPQGFEAVSTRAWLRQRDRISCPSDTFGGRKCDVCANFCARYLILCSIQPQSIVFKNRTEELSCIPNR